jgi:hypothetical protein
MSLTVRSAQLAAVEAKKKITIHESVWPTVCQSVRMLSEGA